MNRRDFLRVSAGTMAAGLGLPALAGLNKEEIDLEMLKMVRQGHLSLRGYLLGQVYTAWDESKEHHLLLERERVLVVLRALDLPGDTIIRSFLRKPPPCRNPNDGTIHQCWLVEIYLVIDPCPEFLPSAPLARYLDMHEKYCSYWFQQGYLRHEIHWERRELCETPAKKRALSMLTGIPAEKLSLVVSGPEWMLGHQTEFPQDFT